MCIVVDFSLIFEATKVYSKNLYFLLFQVLEVNYPFNMNI